MSSEKTMTWVNAIIEVVVPLGDVSPSSSPYEKMAAAERVADELNVPDDFPAVVRWEDVDRYASDVRVSRRALTKDECFESFATAEAVLARLDEEVGLLIAMVDRAGDATGASDCA